VIALNKPFRVTCQFRNDAGRATLADYLPVPAVYPAGRLDRDSEGLLLLTDDGRLQHRISAPGRKLAKRYWVQVEGTPDAEALARLRAGVAVRARRTRPASVQRIPEPALWPRSPPVRYRARIPTSWLEIVLHEGRNRQVRHMTAAVGHPTLRLVRHAIGTITVEGLAPGQWRDLGPAEIRRLREPNRREPAG